ncbi:MAG: elongation factor 4 [Candidatus Levybacteria bacterium]|nr:elongation factor 4 [Candidatus Levybacteria bacterium]
MNQQNIRNFAIIAHIDHGKSTLSDRLLEITHTIAKDKLGEQFLDQNPISKERGITIKLAPVRMKYHYQDKEYELNLIDTPGHVDFSYEVSRTLAACEGAVLLVDATQGIQAQTVAHFHTAKKEGLVMIPVINKIDLPNAQTQAVVKELIEVFGFSEADVIFISAKTGENVPLLLQKIVEKFPSPKGDANAPLRALIFDAVYDEYRGVVSYTRIIDGSIKKGDKVQLFQSQVKTDVTDVGYFSPYLASSEELATGEIGYVITGIKNIREARVGDTIIEQNSTASALPGYTTPKPMVFFGMYPRDQKDFAHLRDSLGKLSLNDTALTYSEEYSAYLGSGFRVGFLGLLHAEIVKERLKQEFDLDLLLTMPQVLYDKRDGGIIFEPYMLLTVYVPTQYVGGVMGVCQKNKGSLLDMQYHESYATLSYEMPYSMFMRGLSAEIKSISSGFASLDYEITEYKLADLEQLEVRINDNPIDVLSELVYKDEALYVAREKASKLKDALPRQQFRQIIQAVVNNTIVAREEIPPFRKDVLQKLYGGDRTRKDKLLEAQKKGKSRMLHTGKVQLPQEALFSLIEN